MALFVCNHKLILFPAILFIIIESYFEMSNNGRHTILLIQRGRVINRNYWDFPTVNQCMSFLVDLFEKELIRLNPQKQQLTYTINDIYAQIDAFEECNMLVFNPDINAYDPYGKGYIKDRLLRYLQHLNLSCVCLKHITLV